MSSTRPVIVELPKIFDPRGNLSFIQDYAQVPFKIKRTYWIYDVPGGEIRHGHAFKKNIELIVALSGSFDVVTTDPDNSEHTFHLCRSYYGLVVPAGTWRRLDNFSTNSVALILSSELYDENDYIRDFDEYKKIELSEPEVLNPISATEKDLSDDPHAYSNLEECKIIGLQRIRHKNGALTAVENSSESHFHISRVFYLYDVPGDSERGGHSHFRSSEYIIAASGCFDVTLSDGIRKQKFTLRRPYEALYIPTGIWRSLDNFSSGSVSLVLTTHPYSEKDYVRSYDEFIRRTSCKKI